MPKLLISILILSFMISSLGAQTVKIDEDFLQKMALKGSPRLDEIQAAFLAANVRDNEIKEEYAPELFGRSLYSETNERALVQFQPVFSPVFQAQLGVRKKLPHGLTATAAAITDQRSAGSTAFTGSFNQATTTAFNFTMQMDLWKNLFGRVSKAKLSNADLEARRAELEKEIQTKSYSLSLRRIYWSLVANEEAIKISENLLKTAKSQVAETVRRFKNSVAETDEVARYKAQVASREGHLLYLKYQKEALLKNLKNLLPELAGSQIALAKYDLKGTLDDVLACTAVVAGEKNVPYKFTKYDEVSNLIREIKSNQQVINSRYSDADVQLFGTVKTTGVSSEPSERNFKGSYGGSLDDIQEHNRSGYEVGVSFTLPLGEAAEKTKTSKQLYDEKRLNAAINNSDARVVNTHQELIRSIKYLADVMKSQKENSYQLERRLKFMRRKYEQARASVTELVLDQDAHLNAELATIDTQLQILNVLFDYLAIYTDTPCSFNRI